MIDPSILTGLGNIATELGINVTASALYDVLKSAVKKRPEPTIADVAADLRALPDMRVEKADVFAEKAVKFLASKGYLTIDGSKIHAKESLVTGSAPAGATTVSGSTLSTDRTRIDVGHGAAIRMSGGASIEQDKDGNIIFRT